MNCHPHPGLVLAAALWACVPASSSAPGGVPAAANGPAMTGDGCAFHLTADACRADSEHGCAWDERTTTCASATAPDAGAAAPSCTCPAGGTCVASTGEPVSPSTTTVTCVPSVPGCTPTGPCTCLTGQRDCAPSPRVSGLCLCAGLRQ